MPISFGSKLSSSIANSTFLDKSGVGDTFTSTLVLRKFDGDTTQINDVQEAILNNKKLIVSNQTISASGTITKSDSVFNQIRRVSGDGAAQTASNTPFGDSSSTEDGITIVLRGTDSVNTITIENNDAQYGAILNGDATLQNYFEIELMYDAIAERWIEQRRNF